MLEWLFAMGRLIEYIDTNAINNPTLAQIAAQIGYSPYHCSEKFHQITGMTIREYMAKRRLCVALEMLDKTERGIVEIAMDCGFSSQQALTRAFTKSFGCTPGAYRKNSMNYLPRITKEVAIIMESRKVFDTIPEAFDKYRPHYSPELFTELISYGQIGPKKTVLELGPGTGQATDPILNTGCDYHAIELGKHLAAKMREKYGQRDNFHIVNDDFVTHDFGVQRFDLIYSARTIQWIPENVAFSKTFELLKPGGILAMINLNSEYKTPNPHLFEEIQKVYSAHFRPVTQYQHRNFGYQNVVNYGFTDYERREYYGRRKLDAQGYVNLVSTHSDHITIPEPHRTPFFEGLRQAVLNAGNVLEYRDTHILMLCRKPE